MDRSTGSPISPRNASLSPLIGEPSGEHMTQEQNVPSPQNVSASHHHGTHSSPMTSQLPGRSMSTRVLQQQQQGLPPQHTYISSGTSAVSLHPSPLSSSPSQQVQSGYYEYYAAPSQSKPSVPYPQPYGPDHNSQRRDYYGYAPVSSMARFQRLSPSHGPYGGMHEVHP